MKQINVKSKLLNLSELARHLGTQPQTLYNRIHLNKGKELSAAERSRIDEIVNGELFGNERIPLENIDPETL